MFENYFGWAFAVGNEIIEPKSKMYDKERGLELVKRLLYEIRGEETPGRFLEKLSVRLTEYKTNTNIQANVSILPEIMSRKWHGDQFYYLKAAILAGFLNTLSKKEGEIK